MATMIQDTLLSKAQVLDSFKELPDRISADTLIEHILFIQSVTTGIQQAEIGQTTQYKEAMNEIRSRKK